MLPTIPGPAVNPPAVHCATMVPVQGDSVWNTAPARETPRTIDKAKAIALLREVFATAEASTSTPAPDEAPRCGTAILGLIQAYWEDLPAETREMIPLCFRPTPTGPGKRLTRVGEALCDSSLVSEHFRVHFASQGPDLLPGYPDLGFAQNLAGYLESAYDYYTLQLGLPAPLPDGVTGGDDGRVDCYVYRIANGFYGYAHIEDHGAGDCRGGRSGSLDITTNYAPRDPDEESRRAAAHEVFHLFQYALGAYADSWLKESTARDMEGKVWPDVEPQMGFNGWFTSPQLPLWSTELNREYAPHFWYFLEQTREPAVVRDLWQRVCENHWRAAFDRELAALGTTLDKALVQFGLWNACTGERDDGRHYAYGANFPAVAMQAEHSAYPVQFAQLPDVLTAQPTGSNYIRFSGPARDNTLRINFEGHPDLAEYRRVSFIASRGTEHTEWTLAPDQNGCVSIHIPDWARFDSVTMVVTNFDLPDEFADSLGFRYSAAEVSRSLLGGDQTSDPATLTNAPEPVSAYTEIHLRTPGEGVAELSIYDLRGRKVRELVHRVLPGGETRVVWDCRDDAGRPVAGGTYLARLSSG